MQTIRNGRINLLAPMANARVDDFYHIAVWFMLNVDLIGLVHVLLGRLR